MNPKIPAGNRGSEKLLIFENTKIMDKLLPQIFCNLLKNSYLTSLK